MKLIEPGQLPLRTRSQRPAPADDLVSTQLHSKHAEPCAAPRPAAPRRRRTSFVLRSVDATAVACAWP
jgi:hypothetical protein